MCHRKPITFLMSTGVLVGFAAIASVDRHSHERVARSRSTKVTSYDVENIRVHEKSDWLEDHSSLIVLDTPTTPTPPSTKEDKADGDDVEVKSDASGNASTDKKRPEDAKKRSGKKKQLESAELSVPPLDLIEYPDNRPIWVVAGVDQIPIGDGYMSPFDSFLSDEEGDEEESIVFTVRTSPCTSPERAKEQIRWHAQAAVAVYCQTRNDFTVVNQFYGDLDVEDFVSDEYVGSLTKGGETLYECAWRLELDESDQAMLLQKVQNAEVGERLAVVGVLSILGFVGTLASGGVLGMMNRRSKKAADRKVEN